MIFVKHLSMLQLKDYLVSQENKRVIKSNLSFDHIKSGTPCLEAKENAANVKNTANLRATSTILADY